MPLTSLTGLTQQEKEKFCATIYAALITQYNAKALGFGNIKNHETGVFRPNQALVKQALERTYGSHGGSAQKYRAIINNPGAWLDIMNSMSSVFKDYGYNANELDSSRAYNALIKKEQHRRHT